MSEKPSSALDDLTTEQLALLKQIEGNLLLEKITVSFSLEGRDAQGQKRTAFYSVNAFPQGRPGYTLEEARVARCLVAKHVVAVVYDDAVKRGLLPAAVAVPEAKAILAQYDNSLVRVLRNGNGGG